MPLPARAKPTPARMVLRARHDVGTLARFHVLDGRQHRSTQACQPGNRAGGRVIDERCPELPDAARTVLGGAQERWLARGLAGTGPRWTFVAQQTLMARASRHVDGRPPVPSDAWDGSPPARDRLLRGVSGAGGRGCVVLSGDAHTA